MACKKIDNRIQVLIENGVTAKHRTMFVVVGERAKDQVILLHHLLLKSTRGGVKPSKILWCSKKELDFSKHRRKILKSIKNKVEAGKFDINSDDPFQLFIISNNIHHCYYNETQNVLGHTYEMCILQDFEALTPNLLARTIETVQGGGIIIILLQAINSLKQLYTMSMDVHQRFRTEAHQDVVCRFNERFLLSLASCERCLVVDDNLNALPITAHNLKVDVVPKDSSAVDDRTNIDTVKMTSKDHGLESVLIDCCKTIDQAKVLLKFIEIISEKTLCSTISLTAARGRGKSATLGLAIAGAVALGYSNIFISSPSPENLKTLFEFIVKGFDALAYEEHCDYSLIQSTNPELNKTVVRVNIFRNHRQTIQYIYPREVNKLSHAELLVIDEAAAIPLPYIKDMLGPYLVFLSSTINGYEGTGRSLSLKLLEQLRIQTAISSSEGNKMENANSEKADEFMNVKRQLYELTLDESIRYKSGDKIEEWLTNILCLDATTHTSIASVFPSADKCQLYYINRDTLFSYHKASELFLQRLIALYVASHYKNSPNDLQMMSDAPAHHLFCLLGPMKSDCKSQPEILVVIQVCLEGDIKKQTIEDGLGRGRRAAGDLIPWTIAQQYQDNNFAQLAGARIVRIATHPDYHRMGYGTRAFQLLKQYYEMKIPYIDVNMTSVTDENMNSLTNDTVEPRSALPPLLSKLSERRPERLDYLGVSFGLTESLLKFWKRLNFVLVYLRQTTNDITGEHSCIMLSKISIDGNEDFNWLEAYWKDFRRRFTTLLSYSFTTYSSSLALSVLTNNNFLLSSSIIDKRTLDIYFTSYDIIRLEMYGKSMADYHLIMDLLPALSKLYFLNLMNDTHFSHIQAAILLGLGFQHKTVDQLAEELGFPTTQLLGLFNRMVRKFVQYLNDVAGNVVEKRIAKELKNTKSHSNNRKYLENEFHEVTVENPQSNRKKESKQLIRKSSDHFTIKDPNKSSICVNSKKRSNSLVDNPIHQLSNGRKHKKKKK